MNDNKILVAVSGASGSIYANVLLNYFNKNFEKNNISIIFSETAKKVWEFELENKNYLQYKFEILDNNNFFHECASGSGNYKTMIICPCSMGTLGRIANGIANDLIARSADVILKEKRKLILIPRETPFNLIHLQNMKTIALAGGIIMPPCLSFYNKNKNIAELIDDFIKRVLSVAGFDIDCNKKWLDNISKEN